MIRTLGNEHFCHPVDADMLPIGATVLDCGVGRDVSFSEALAVEKEARIVFVDPDGEALAYAKTRLPGATLVQAAVAVKDGMVKLYPALGSQSLYSDHRGCCGKPEYVEGMSLAELVSRFRPHLVKLDVEGAEYDVLWQADGVSQISVEFHHGIVARFTQEDTNGAVAEMSRRGYEAAMYGDRDALFIKK